MPIHAAAETFTDCRSRLMKFGFVFGLEQMARMKKTAEKESWKLMLSREEGLTSNMPMALKESACRGSVARWDKVAIITTVHMTAARTRDKGMPVSIT